MNCVIIPGIISGVVLGIIVALINIFSRSKNKSALQIDEIITSITMQRVIITQKFTRFIETTNLRVYDSAYIDVLKLYSNITDSLDIFEKYIKHHQKIPSIDEFNNIELPEIKFTSYHRGGVKN